MFDLVIRGGTVVDGSGDVGYRADVGVTGEVIAAIGDLSAPSRASSAGFAASSAGSRSRRWSSE